jgi:hypothetical protein
MTLNCRNILAFIIYSITLISCKNNDNVFPVTQTTSLTIVNATTDTLNYYINGIRQNNTSSLFPGGALVNQSAPAGFANYQFKKSGNANVLFSKALTLKYDSSANYTIGNSFFVYGELPSQNFVILNDTLFNSTAANTATIRVANLSTDAGTIQVSITNNTLATTIAFNEITFGEPSIFKSISSGLNEVKVYLLNNSVAQIDTIISIQPNTVNTIFTKGLLKSGNNSLFSLGAIVNK